MLIIVTLIIMSCAIVQAILLVDSIKDRSWFMILWNIGFLAFDYVSVVRLVTGKLHI